MTEPRVWIEALTFSDGTTIDCGPGDVVVVVGPNNSGKSVALRSIRAKAENPSEPSPVVADVRLARSGTAAELAEWVARVAVRNPGNPDNPSFSTLGATVHKSHLGPHWDGSRGLGPLTRFFINLLNASDRLAAANPAPQIRLVQDPPAHPLHYLQRDDRLEEEISSQFHAAFGEDLVLNRNAGSEVPLLVGDKPSLSEGQDRVSYGYLEKLALLPAIHQQGDGMRSFTGVLLHTSFGPESVILIDEPEAFLHPPQAW
ncbi:MAG: ATP-binding protein, partial [Bacillota bacterium]|nr:ATP-binding protein [Bacillota bacterium]